MPRLLATALLAAATGLGCEPVQDDFEGPSDQFEGRVSAEEDSDRADALDGDIDTGDWADPADEEPVEDPPDEEPEPVTCTSADLLFVAEVLDGAGTPQVAFVVDEDLSFVGRTINPCDGTVTLTTATSCLVQRWEIKDSAGITYGLKPDCDDGAWDWDLSAGDELLQTSESRRLPAGDYTLTVRFNAEPHQAKESFTIE